MTEHHRLKQSAIIDCGGTPLYERRRPAAFSLDADQSLATLNRDHLTCGCALAATLVLKPEIQSLGFTIELINQSINRLSHRVLLLFLLLLLLLTCLRNHIVLLRESKVLVICILKTLLLWLSILQDLT